MKLKLLTKNNQRLLVKVGIMISIIIPTFLLNAHLQYPIQFSQLIRLNLDVPYQDGIEEIFWDWDGDNVIYTSKFFYQPSSHTLTIHHKKISSPTFFKTYRIDVSNVFTKKKTFFMYDLAFNYQDSVIAIIANRGLVLLEMNTNQTLYIPSDLDTSFCNVFYHAPSNSLILHSLYFYHPNDVKNPEVLYQVKYDVKHNNYTLIKYPIHFPELPYSLLISQFMDVDSLIILTNMFQHQITVLNTAFQPLINYSLGEKFNPPYHIDSLLIFRNNMQKLIYPRLKLYDFHIERIEKVYTTSGWIFVTVKPKQVVDFDKRNIIILKMENDNIRLVSHFSINYRSKPYTIFNLFNFTTDDRIYFRKKKVAVCTMNYGNDLQFNHKSQKIQIRNIKKYAHAMYEENPKFQPTYALYVSDWSIAK
jgi:hypothetical protein